MTTEQSLTAEGLKPCPHCGEEPLAHAIEPHTHVLPAVAAFMPDHHGSYVIECAGCGNGMIGEKEADVVARWNRRALRSQPTFAQGIEAAAWLPVGDVFLTLEKGREYEVRAKFNYVWTITHVRALSPAEPGMVSVAFEAKKLLDDICVVVDETPEAALAMFPRGLIARVRKHLLAAAKSEAPTLICEKCGADRYKEDCRLNHPMDCPIHGTAASAGSGK